jgi:magnesium-protoporphyrin O-methyltransferase
MTTPPPGKRFCCDEDLASIGYDGLNADQDLERWRSGRLFPPSAELIEIVRGEGIAGAALLDIGAGVGAIHLSLLEAGAATAIDVDASREFLAVARAEAERRGLADRVDHRYGDIVELAPDLPPVDIVTMDSVICCYPYLGPLLDAAVRSRPRVVGITYPRDTWWMRLYMHAYNVIETLRRRPGRYFVHRHSELDRLMADAGYRNAHEGGIRPWRVVLYRRIASRSGTPVYPCRSTTRGRSSRRSGSS